MRFYLAIFIALLASPTYATPPETLTLHDKVIGVSETQLFILRETRDNLGMHIYGMHDVFLVAKNISTGVDEEIWPVFRVHSALVAVPPTLNFPLTGAINPFEIMAERAAKYIGDDFEDLGAKFVPDAGIDGEMLWVRDASMDIDAVMAQINQSVALTSETIQPYPKDGYASMTNFTPQDGLSLQLLPSECRIVGVMTHYPDPYKVRDFAKVICEDEEYLLLVALVVVIPG